MRRVESLLLPCNKIWISCNEAQILIHCYTVAIYISHCNVKRTTRLVVLLTLQWEIYIAVKLEVEDHGFERLGWYGHVKHSNIAVRTTCGIQAVRWHRPLRPEVMWKKLTENHCPEWKLAI